MTYLLDTNACVEVLRDAAGAVSRRMHTHAPGEIGICAVVVHELYYGAYRSIRPAQNVASTRRFVQTFLCLPFDDQVAEVCADLRLI